MAKKRPPVELEGLTENLKESSGKGMNAFFPTPPLVEPSQAQPKKPETAKVDDVSQQESNIYSNKKTNKEDNTASNITI